MSRIPWAPPSYWSGVFSKVHMFNLTQHAKQVAYVDTDAFLVDRGADNVFSACAAELCAARDAYEGGDIQAAMINVGVLVAKTSKDRFHDLLLAAPTVKPSRFPEQLFFSTYFNVSRSAVQDGTFQALPGIYNPCNGDMDLVNKSLIFHACGDMKFEMLPLCSWAVPASRQADFCNNRIVAKFQELLVASNSCAMAGQHASACDANPECQWCGDMVRCRSRARSCMLETPGTAAMSTRLRLKSRGWAWVNKLLHELTEKPDNVSMVSSISLEPSVMASVTVLTCNRNAFLQNALEQIVSQDYPSLEVVVVDDGSESIASTLQPRLQRLRNHIFSWKGLEVQLIRLQEPASLGEKRNIALQAARGGVIVHWDDDDMYPPWRIRAQVEPIMSGRAQMTALPHSYFVQLPNATFFKYEMVTDEGYKKVRAVFLGSLVYQREMALKVGGFANVSAAEDYEFSERALLSCRSLLVVDEPSIYVRHGGGAHNSWQWDRTAADIKMAFGRSPAPG
ncbi:unnamed protein product [Prorocentrum cordatum]|uniref:Glycosyltransferase 2-like domain-containing protein n=1 Tax=Prorocentrum cordatum TaxID=2364126 RepID=A0ABN9V262_9DINO|nr:unnamed protein product [Polarella glacialis]